jgi:RNA 2',3'-cyclic 3'-phosphodiesterase
MAAERDAGVKPGGASRTRLFSAAVLPEAVLAEVAKVQQPLAEALGREVRWPRPGQVHLTLKFHGNVCVEQIEALKAALRRAALGISPFTLAVERIGCFPSMQRPSVIWLGVDGDLGPLKKLHARVAQETDGFGSHRERREFHPHLTIGRVKAFGAVARKVGDAVRSTHVPRLGEWTVRELTLYRSELSKGGSIYTPLCAIPIAADQPGEAAAAKD